MADRKSRVTIGHDHGYDAEFFCLRLALDPNYVEGYVDGCPEGIGEDDPDCQYFVRDIWEEGLKSGVEVRPGGPPE